MRLYSVINHFAHTLYACSSLEDAKESLSCELEYLRDIGQDKGFRPFLSFATGQIVDHSGRIYCEINTLDVDTTEWDLEMWAVLQEANS